MTYTYFLTLGLTIIWTGADVGGAIITTGAGGAGGANITLGVGGAIITTGAGAIGAGRATGRACGGASTTIGGAIGI